MANDKIARRAVVSGRVQGVFFRAFTQEEARRLGVCGWVRNRPDGRVEAWIEGPPPAVERMLAWLWEGSPSSNVTAVEVEEVEADGLYREFSVRH